MLHHDITVDDITFRAVPLPNDSTGLQIYCSCRYCNEIKPDTGFCQLGYIIHRYGLRTVSAALPFRLDQRDEPEHCVELPTRATSIRQGIREFYEAHLRHTSLYWAQELIRAEHKRRRLARIDAAKEELARILNTER